MKFSKKMLTSVIVTAMLFSFIFCALADTTDMTSYLFGSYTDGIFGSDTDAEQLELGDIDGVAGVTAADARLALRYSVSLEDFNEAQYKAADVNYDNKVDASDARLILRVSVKLDQF